MVRTLKDFVLSRRVELGWTQTELAKNSGVPRTTVNRIEKGTTKLPEADVRRKLAMTLGVRHVDLLIAAGELAEDEVEPPVITHYDPNPDVARVVKLAHQVSWNPARLSTVEGVLRLMIDPREDAWDIERSDQEDNTADMTPENVRRRREATERGGRH